MINLTSQMSWHIRGPFNLDAFAVYRPSTNSKRAISRISSGGHGQRRAHKMRVEHRGAGDPVTATINGVVKTFLNDWSGSPTERPQQNANAPAPGPVLSPADSCSAGRKKENQSSNGTKEKNKEAPVGDFMRVAYYNASSQTGDGLVFLANKGDPAVSGTWDK